MKTALTVRNTWMSRLLKAVRFIRVANPTEFEAGSDYVAGNPAFPGYDPLRAMSAMAAVPWVVACVRAIATDLSGLDLIATDPNTGERFESHPVIDLLSMPASRTSEVLFRRQLVVDLELVGSAYSLVLSGRSLPESLLRMHPARTEVVPRPDGQPDGYLYRGLGAQKFYEYDDVLHWRYESWEDDPRSMYGSGAIRALDREIQADIQAVKRYAESASQGRPDAIYRPDGDTTIWTRKQMEDLNAALQKMMQDKHAGVGILNAMGKLEILGWSPRDMEFAEGRTTTRDSVMGVFGVPPTRVGLPTANYATARQQDLVYWQGLMGKSALLDDQFTRIGMRYPRPAVVKHDFSRIDALQDGRNDNLQRVSNHILNGVPTIDAYKLEGFADVAAVLERQRDNAPAPVAPPAEDDPQQEGIDIDSLRFELRAALDAIRNGDDVGPEDIAASIEEALAIVDAHEQAA